MKKSLFVAWLGVICLGPAWPVFAQWPDECIEREIARRMECFELTCGSSGVPPDYRCPRCWEGVCSSEDCRCGIFITNTEWGRPYQYGIDYDGDGLENTYDNCPLIPNPDQQDVDGDAHGDLCDNCVFVDNEQQCDGDEDGLGDVCDDGGGDLGESCDTDADGDGVLDPVDNCPQQANRRQKDSDRDGLGDRCDPIYCYVVDEIQPCLDPAIPFGVYGGADRVVRTGETVPLLFWANRKNRGMRYEWVLLERPAIAEAAIVNPSGAVSLSTPHNYHYLKGRLVEFTPDQPGVYRIRVAAKLAFDDKLYPGHNSAEHVLNLTATGDPATSGYEGCSTSGEFSPGLWFLLGLGYLVRRRQ